MLLLTAGAIALGRALDAGRPAWTWGLWFALVAITRPEGLLFGLVSLLVYAGWLRAQRLPFRSLVLASAAVLTLPSLQLLWRLWYYDALLPNTFYVKMDANTAFYLRGLDYVLQAALRTPLMAVGFVLAAALLAHSRPSIRTWWLLACCGVLATVIEGGDSFYGPRMLVPFVPLVCLVTGDALARVLARLRWAPRAGGAVLALGLALLAVRLGVSWRHEETLHKIRESAPDMAGRRVVGEWVAANSSPGDWIATPAAGLLPFVADRPTIDCLGLTDRHIGRRELSTGSGRAGHEKGDGAYVLSRRPRFLIPWHRPLPVRLSAEQLLDACVDRTTVEYRALPAFQHHYRLRVDPHPAGFIHVFERIR
jgi:hypothetical protein